MSTAIQREDPTTAEVKALFDESDTYHGALYPPEFNYLADGAALRAAGAVVLVARVDGRAVATGAVAPQPGGWGEVKRVYVSEAVRGRGLGRRMMEALEAEAGREGLRLLRLETGVRQPDAIGLYHAAGYRTCPAFGDYALDPSPLSVFMEKSLPGAP